MQLRRLTVPLVTLLVLLVTAAPAVADHNYGHRLVIVGRVVDAAGEPVADADVTVRLQRLEFEASEAPCVQETCSTTTGPMGDYSVYWHAHGIGESGQVTVEVQNKTVGPVSFDRLRRWVAVNVQLDEDVDRHDAQALARWNRTYTVTGMVWVDGGSLPDPGTGWVDGSVPGCLEENRVTIRGSPRCGRVDANVTVTLPDGTEIANTTSISPDYGRFSITLEGASSFDSGQVTVDVMDESWSFPVDARHRATLRTFTMPPPPTDPSDFTVPLVIAGLIGGIIVAYFGGRKLKEKREIKKARQRSTRKRAND